MKKERTKALAFESILTIALFICAFFPFYKASIILAIITTVGAIVSSLLLRKKSNTFTNKKQILIIMIVFAILYLALFYTLGIYSGFYRNTSMLSLKRIFVYIIPTIVVIITTEIMRDRLLTVNIRASKILTLLLTVLIDINLFTGSFDLSKLNDFLLFMGFVIFSCLSSNILYSYLSPRYGIKPIIAYRLILSLYAFILPVIPDVYIYFRTFCRMIYPLVIYSYIENYYNPDKEVKKYSELRKDNIWFIVSTIIVVFFIGIVSCKFSYGALIIGSSSMRKEMSKGDIVVYKATKEDLEVGDVIVFNKEDIKVVHRIVKIDKKDSGIRIYTKGDANQNNDDGFITEEDVIGKVEFKISKLGKITLWIRSQFE